MPTVQDINDKIAQLTAKVQANTDATSAVATYVQGLKDQLTAVQQQLADAIAQNDPAALQSASDALDAAITAIDADTASEAAIANTPAQP